MSTKRRTDDTINMSRAYGYAMTAMMKGWKMSNREVNKALLLSIVDTVEATVNMLKADGKPVTRVAIMGNIVLLTEHVLTKISEEDK